MFLFDVPAGWLALLNPHWLLINFLLLGGLLMVGFGTWHTPALGLAGIALALPLYLVRGKIGMLPTTYLELVILVVATVWLATTWQRSSPPTAPDPLRAPILLLLAAGSLTLFWSPDLHSAAGLWKAYLVEPLIVYSLGRAVVRGHADRRLVGFALGTSAAVVALAALWQWFSGVGIAESIWVRSDLRRVTAWYTSPNAVGLYLVPILALLAGWATHTERRTNERVLAGAILLAGLLAVAATKSFGAWLGIGAAVFLLGCYRLGRWRTISITVVMATALLVLPSVRTRVVSEFQDQAGQNRADLWRGTWQYLMSSPPHFLFGAGMAGFGVVHESFRDPRRVEPLIYPHNIVLNFWVEYGLLGLVAAIWIAARIWRIGTRAARHPTDGWQLGALAGLGAMVVHGLVDVPYFKNDLAVLTWLLIVLTLPARGQNSADPVRSGGIDPPTEQQTPHL